MLIFNFIIFYKKSPQQKYRTKINNDLTVKKILLLGVLILSVGFSSAQINVDLIKKNVTENQSENFNPLLELFKTDPNQLSQEELNQLYYGSKFLKSEYTLGDYNKDYNRIWKLTTKKMSKSKAEKIIRDAELRYQKNPLDKQILDNMYTIYGVLGETEKANLCIAQKNAILNTIEKSGDGKSEESPICVIRPGDALVQLDRFSFIDITTFEQKTSTLSDGSILSMYKMGDEKYYVKLVGGYYF